ncbi:MAG: histidinol-phosphatase [Treponema sp.]|nr:histidinol-phosphatase [Treponema sp.]
MEINPVMTNLHTHSTFCDGKASPEEMVQAALEAGLSVLGFSSHSIYPFSSDWHMAVEEHQAYCDEVRRLKEVYAGRIEIQLGFETDYISGMCVPSFERYAAFSPDFIIGSVHYIGDENYRFAVDNTREELSRGIERVYNGNVREAVSHYFACEREMLQKGDFTIAGHLDLVRKFNGSLQLFSEADSWYRQEVKATAQAVFKAGVIAEINTGGMVRAGVPTPYPSPYFLEQLHELGVPVTVTSDAHSPEHISAKFDFAREYAKKAGYKELSVPVSGSIRTIPL